MIRELLNRYIWIVDTIRRHATITREELNERWRQSPFSNGDPLPRRTFYNYRQGIEELLGLRILYNPTTYEYYIDNDNPDQDHPNTLTDWILNSASMSNLMADMSSIADKVFLEDVPSARLYLSTIIGCIKEHHPVRFTYHPYTRSLPTSGVTVEPYFLKIFRQRWYLTGRNSGDKKIKTYALDRMSDVTVVPSTFAPPESFNASEFVRDAFGIVFSHGKVYDVVLKVTSRRAKYLRALPLHHSQEEAIHDEFSIFNYRLRLTPDLVQEILSYGSEITVVAPAELRAMIVESLRCSLDNYNNIPNDTNSPSKS